MCGIVGYIGFESISNEVLMHGLQALEYRGYDSAGIALLDAGKIEVYKSVGKVQALQALLDKKAVPQAQIGIAHTRWATHGKPTCDNAHPHAQGAVCIVHNGVIENYSELRVELEAQGYIFKSDTDTEVAAAYLDAMYQLKKDKLEACLSTCKAIKGSFAFGILFEGDTTLYAMRRNSPLLIATSDTANFIASDISAVLEYTSEYIILGQDEIAEISKDRVQVYDLHKNVVKHKKMVSTISSAAIGKAGFEHFMLKEMYEEPTAIRDTIAYYIQNHLSDLHHTLPDFSKYDRIQIVACGSAMHAGMVAKNLIEQLAQFEVVVDVASEFRYRKPILKKHDLVLVISQSGETADSLAALLLAKQQGIDTMAIVNVFDSSIAREAKYVAYTYAGREIAVATTKAYSAQVTLLILITLRLLDMKKMISMEQANTYVMALHQLPETLSQLLEQQHYVSAAEYVAKHNSVFYLGRGIDFAIALEGSLKLKEISYILSEAYPAGELKHGTISLIEEGTPVMAICSDLQILDKTLSNIKEVKARGAKVILFINDTFEVSDDCYDYLIRVPQTVSLLQPLLTILPLQMLSYYVAKMRGCDIDQPRNLAKSVTVE